MSNKLFASSSQVRWCPGCGDYAVLKHLQTAFETIGYKPDEVVVISGIGCSSRLPYYLSCYGFHTLHGRAFSVASGLAISRPDLPIVVITGDGDGLSIGLGGLLHTLRRNVNITVLLLNNQIYGLTKGQYSPTSAQGLKTKTSPLGSQENPLDPLKLALASGATFLARSMDVDGKMLTSLIAEALNHQGTSLIEVYQNCPIFNDGVYQDFSTHSTVNKNMFFWPGKAITCQKSHKWQLLNGDLHPANEEAVYGGSYHEAWQSLSITDHRGFGLFYKTQKPIWKKQSSDNYIQGSYHKAFESLLTFDRT